MTTVFTTALWPSIFLWLILYVSDYAFTLACARMYQAGVRDVLVFQGSLELTPYFQKDVDSLRTVSPRFLLAALWSTAWLALLWWVARSVWPEAFLFGFGAMVLVEVTVHLRHFRNFFLFRRILAGHGVRGRIEYDRPLLMQLSATEMGSFAALYGIAFLATWSPFFFGGAVGCLSLARKHLFTARRLLRDAAREPRVDGPQGRT